MTSVGFVAVILLFSIALQLAAAVTALRLIPLTGRRLAWIFVSAAIFLMTARRALTFSRLLTGDLKIIPDLQAEIIALIISIFMVAGLYLLIPHFKKMQLAEKDLRRARSEWEDIFQAVGHPAFILAPDYTIQEANKAVRKLTGKGPQEIIGRKCFDIMHGAAGPVAGCPLAECISNRHAELSEVEVQLAGGIFMISCTPVFDEGGRLTKVIHVATNITELKNSKRALENSERRFRLLAENAKDIIYRISLSDGKLEYISPAAAAITGYAPEDYYLDPRLADKIVHPRWRDHVREHWGKLLAGDTAPPAEYQIISKQGQVKWIMEHVSLARNEDGTPLAAEGIITDITERKNMEETIRQTEKMEAIGQLAGGIAHDFNNLLGSIMGHAELLSLQLDDDHMRGFAENIVKACGRAADLTTALLSFARKGKYLTIAVDLHQIIHEVVGILTHSLDKRININLSLSASSSVIIGDPSQIQTALLNLAINARDAMPDGGTIAFATDAVNLDEGFCRGNPWEITPGAYISVAVSDSGIGMDQETMHHLFEPFYTTKAPGKGTGMGLASVYGTVKSHRGAIHVYSQPGHGATFRIFLPLSEAETSSRTAGEKEKPQRGSGQILVVDDEELICVMLKELLVELGYRVTTCRDGAEAVELYGREWPKIDLVILDMIMPRLSGRDTFLAMRRINPGIRALLASGYSVNGEAQTILQEGVIDFLQKPFQITELANKIQAALGGDPPGI